MIPLAVTSRDRVKALPQVPTIAESGVPDYQINAFHGILAPAGTPPAVIARLEKDITEVLKSPEVNKKLIDLGFDPVAGSAADSPRSSIATCRFGATWCRSPAPEPSEYSQ